MRSELKWVLILLVLTIAIWTVTFVLSARPGANSTMSLLLLIGSVWATFDFLRALWRYVRAVRAPDDEEAID